MEFFSRHRVIVFIEPGHAGAGFWSVRSVVNRLIVERSLCRGDYRNCDIPIWTAQVMLQHASQYDDVSDGDRISSPSLNHLSRLYSGELVRFHLLYR